MVRQRHNNRFPYRSPLELTLSPIWSEPESRREALDATYLRRAAGTEGTGQERARCWTRHQCSYGNMLDVLPAYRISVASSAIKRSVGTDDPDTVNLTKIRRSAGAELITLDSFTATH